MVKNVKKKISRIVRQKLILPQGVTYLRDGSFLSVVGPKGKNVCFFHKDIVLTNVDGELRVESDCLSTSMLGTFFVLLRNAVSGVVEKFQKIMNLYGVGYKVLDKNGVLEFFVGYSHSVKVTPPDGVEFEIKMPTQIIFKSCDKGQLGDFVAKISKIRRVNPYKTKGVIAEGAFILKKEGKK